MELTQHFLTENDCYKTGRTIAPRGVMVHSIGVAQPDVNVFLTTWNRSGYEACVHAFVHQGGAVQTLPWNHRGWHCGTGTSGKSANSTHVSFEICEPAGHTYNGGTMVGYDPVKNAAYFAAVYQNAVELTTKLCKQYGLDPLADGVVICHSEGFTRGVASNHADVMHWFPKHGKSMDIFRADVARAMGKVENDLTEAQAQKIASDTLAKELPQAIKTALEQYEADHTYTTLADVPDWGKPTVERLMAQGALKGDEKGQLNLTTDLLRALVVQERSKG